LSSIGDLADSIYARQISQIDDEKNAALSALDSMELSEEEYGKKKEQILEEYDEKRKEVLRKQAEGAKALALLEAVVNTAAAVVKALPNVALSIAAGALGAIQIAAIAAEPVPAFAEGADFITSGAQYIKVGDNPGGRERVRVTPLSSPNINGPGDSPLHITIRLGNDLLYDKIHEGTMSGDILIDRRAIV
jgi:hypothetical protein